MNTGLTIAVNSSGALSGPESKLMIGRMFEDWTIESSLFSPGGRVFCIASAGCTVLELAARGHRVDAVDQNPAQVRYLKERLSGAHYRDGMVDHYLRRGRRFLSSIGPKQQELEQFLLLRDPTEQTDFWKTHFISRGKLLDTALHELLFRFFCHRKCLRTPPRNFGQLIRNRLERGFSIHSNRTNNYAWRLLLDRESPEQPAKAPITIAPRVHCCDAVHFLESCPPGHYDGFSFSNIVDGADAIYEARLWNAVRRAARPGAIIVLRSFQEPANESESYWASQDRAMLWGGIIIHRL